MNSKELREQINHEIDCHEEGLTTKDELVNKLAVLVLQYKDQD